jgi:hypothetical protein
MFAVYVIEVAADEPGFVTASNHITIHRDAPGDYTVDEYRATAAAGVLALHESLQRAINTSPVNRDVHLAMLERISAHRIAALASPCGANATAEIHAVYNELLMEWEGNLPTCSTGMTIAMPDGSPLYITVRAYVCARGQV